MSLPHPEERPTIPLWPDAGQAYGTGKSLTYELAARGEFPGAIRVGRKYVVATAELRRKLGLDVKVAS